MKPKDSKSLVIRDLCLLLPLVIYGIYKNGYLIYTRELTSFFSIFKPLYLILISIIIKIIIDYLKYKHIKIDYDCVIVNIFFCISYIFISGACNFIYR